MLDEMMDKQQRSKLDVTAAAGKLGGSSAAAVHAAASLASSGASKTNKLSKLFDLDEQRLQSAAIIHVSLFLNLFFQGLSEVHSSS